MIQILKLQNVIEITYQGNTSNHCKQLHEIILLQLPFIDHIFQLLPFMFNLLLSMEDTSSASLK